MALARPAPDLPPAISVTGVRRVYATKPKPVIALDGVDLEVAPGEFFGLLGPNGAGKTTLIKILTTLLLPTSGDARIFGFDIATETKRIRRIMNMVAGGEQSGYGILTVREQLWMFSQFYGIGTRDGWKRTDELIEAVGLGEQRLQRVSTLSTGQRQKMNMARGLLNDPWILFLDEPTLGLDVAAARSIRELVLDWKGAVAGRTVLLTTHYMAEADELCERIAIVDHGRILAIGTPGRAQEAGPAGVDLPARARQPRRGHPGAGPAARSRLGGTGRGHRPGAPAHRRQPRPGGGRRAGRRGHGARRHRQPHPRAAQVGAHARGRVRRAGRARVRRRRGRRRRRRERRVRRAGAERTGPGSPRRDDEADGVEDLPPSPSADEAEEAYPVEARR